jgi:hypothetical protein
LKINNGQYISSFSLYDLMAKLREVTGKSNKEIIDLGYNHLEELYREKGWLVAFDKSSLHQEHSLKLIFICDNKVF